MLFLYANAPLKIDFFALFIFLGIAQALFLGGIFFFHKSLPNKLLAFLLWALVALITEILLCYTNLMFEVLWLVDFSEPLNFVVAPLFYLYLRAHAYPEKKKLASAEYLHFLPFACYFLYLSVLVFPQSLAYKYNCYVSAYHPQMTKVVASVYWGFVEVFWVRGKVNELMLLQLLVYQVLSVRLLWRSFQARKIAFWARTDSNLAWVRNIWVQSFVLLVLFIIVKLTFYNDLGDHILATHIVLIIYTISFRVMRQSLFLQTEQASSERVGKKYEKSSLTPEIQAQTLQKLESLMQTEKPYLQADFSLPTLAQKLQVSVHHLSQILNEEMGQTFFEFTAQYRIKEAQILLRAPETTYLKMEEIAERVGYNSKSSFNTSFKKIVGQTPSEWRRG